jgi:hypothetical protein
VGKQLSPLYGAVDPDALDSLFRSADSAGRSPRRVSFRYCECDVVVWGDGRIEATSGDRTVLNHWE